MADNPEVMNTLDALGSDMASALGGPPPPMGGHPPEPAFIPPKEKPLSPTQQKAILAEAASPRGFSTLASKRFAQLGPLMPGAEKVRIRKRRDDGSVASLKDYNYRDVEQQGDVEAFVQTYLFPKYGGGDYEVYLIDATGKEYNAGIVRLWGAPRDPDSEHRAAPPPDPAAGLMPLMVEMYRRSTTPGPDPFTQMRQMKEFLAMDQKPGTDNNMLLAMMQMQQSAAAENQKLLMTLMAPRQDDRLVQMLERFDRRLEKLETAPPPPPPPPMAAPSGPNTAELITAFASAAAAVVPLIKGDGVKATEMAQLIIQAQQAAQPRDTLTVRDAIDIFRDKEAKQSGPATLEEQIGTLVRVKELAGALAPAPQGPQGTTFWDALVTLFGNGDFAKAIGARVDQSMQPQQVNVTSNRPVQNNQQLAENAQGQDGESQPTQPKQPQLQLPPDFAEKCKAIENAQGPGDRVAATVETLMSLRNIDQWKPFIQDLLESVARGEKPKALHGLGNWFGKVLIKGGFLSQEAAVATLQTFDVGFDMVRAGLLERMPGLRALVPVEAPNAPGPQAAPSAPPVAAQPVEESAPVEIPVPTGPAPVPVDIGDADAAAYSNGSL